MMIHGYYKDIAMLAFECLLLFVKFQHTDIKTIGNLLCMLHEHPNFLDQHVNVKSWNSGNITKKWNSQRVTH